MLPTEIQIAWNLFSYKLDVCERLLTLSSPKFKAEVPIQLFELYLFYNYSNIEVNLKFSKAEFYYILS